MRKYIFTFSFLLIFLSFLSSSIYAGTPEIEEEEPVNLDTLPYTEIMIIDDEIPKDNKVVDPNNQTEDRSEGVCVNWEDLCDKFNCVQEAVVVKPEPKPFNYDKPELEAEKIFVAVEQPAEFPGGQAAMMKWISNNIRYPESAQQNGISGRVVVKIVVERDGSVNRPQIVKSVDRDLDQEALRVVKRMPKWKPGKNNGQPVRSYFNIVVTFRPQNQ